jgi:hypothetical protein
VKSLLYYSYWKGLHKMGRRDEMGFAGSQVSARVVLAWESHIRRRYDHDIPE